MSPGAAPHVDRLSPLSDDLLHHILSFLPDTYHRARTSLLSRRFRHLWSHHPSVRLSIPMSRPSPTSSPDSYVFHSDRHLVALSSCLRSLLSPSLLSLSLDAWLATPDRPCLHLRILHQWLRLAAARSVRSLSLRAITDDDQCNTVLPSSLFACYRSLACLELEFFHLPTLPKNFPGFRSLRTLILYLVPVDPYNLDRLFDGCPLLEKLEMYCGYVGPSFVDISSFILPRLEHFLLMGFSPWTEVTVEGENLSFIRFEADLGRLEWKGSPALHTACLMNRTGEAFGSLSEWMEVVSAAANAQVLGVNYWFYQFEIPKDSSRGPMFKNLKELHCDIDWVTGSLLRSLTSNLGEFPLLEELYIQFNADERRSVKNAVQSVLRKELIFPVDPISEWAIIQLVEGVHEQDGSDLSDHTADLGYTFQHLKTVVLREFMGSDNEMRLALFLLARAVALEDFVVFDYLRRDEVDLNRLFAPFPRASTEVEMKFFTQEPHLSNKFLKKIPEALK